METSQLKQKTFTPKTPAHEDLLFHSATSRSHVLYAILPPFIMTWHLRVRRHVLHMLHVRYVGWNGHGLMRATIHQRWDVPIGFTVFYC